MNNVDTIQTENTTAPSRAWSDTEVAAFTKRLTGELRDAGVFRGDAVGYQLRTLWVLIMTTFVWSAIIAVDSWAARIVVDILAAYICVQAAAIAHEAGHGAITRDRKLTWIIGRFFMTFLFGMSYSSWVERHGAHHVHPNSRKDPDARPSIFSFNEVDAAAARGLAGWCTRNQHLLLIPISTMMGFSLKLSGWKHVLRRPRKAWTDLVVLLVHVTVWIVLPAIWIGVGAAVINYALLTWAEGAYLAFVFLPNHLGGPTSEEASAWHPALRQIVTARNLPSNRLLNHLLVGLNTHIEHHVFGHVPATRLPEARAITRHLCEIYGVPYRECTVGQAFAEVHRYNKRIARSARDAQRLRNPPTCTAIS